MIGKKVRVFWPLDEQWYVGVVKEYDESSGEHLLKYPDGDTEWVKIGDTQQQMDGLGGNGESGADAVQSPPRILSKASHGGPLPVPSMESPDRVARDYGPPPGYPPYPPHPYPPYGPPYQGVSMKGSIKWFRSCRLHCSTSIREIISQSLILFYSVLLVKKKNDSTPRLWQVNLHI